MTNPRYMQDRVPNHLRRAKYRIARALGIQRLVAAKIREWSMSKFLDYCHIYKEKKLFKNEANKGVKEL